MTHHQKEFGCEKYSSFEHTGETITFCEDLNPDFGTDLENSDSNFLHDAVTHDDVPLHKQQFWTNRGVILWWYEPSLYLDIADNNPLFLCDTSANDNAPSHHVRAQKLS